MALVINDRVKVHSTTIRNRCNITLAGVASGQGFETFAHSGIGNN